jgi:hypothetical protein
MDLRQFFERHHLIRQQATGGPVAAIAPPALAYGRGDLRRPPNPDEHGYRLALHAMTLLDYHRFIAEWLIGAAEAGRVRCAVCDRVLPGDGEPRLWHVWAVDGAYVCWLPVHLACRQGINRAIGLLTPPLMTPRLRTYDVSEVVRTGDDT